MITLEMKNCNMILTEKQLKYQCDHLENLIKMKILQVLPSNQILPSNQRQIREPVKLAYSPLGKTF